jgi:hypothetical protein
MPVCPRYRSSCRLVADRETIPKRASGKLARSVTKAAGAEPLLAIAHGLMDHGQTGSRPWRRPRYSAPSLPTRPDELGEPKRESALSTGGSKGVLTPRLQVNESNAQEIRAFASQPGIPSEPPTAVPESTFPSAPAQNTGSGRDRSQTSLQCHNRNKSSSSEPRRHEGPKIIMRLPSLAQADDNVHC